MKSIFKILIVVIFIKITIACRNNCIYDNFFQSYNVKFIYHNIKGKDTIVEELIFTSDYYIHNTFVNAMFFSDTNRYEYNNINGQITTFNLVDRYDRVTGDNIFSQSTSIFQYRCDIISLGDIHFVKDCKPLNKP